MLQQHRRDVLADQLGVSKVTVFEHVEALIKKGALVREANKARSLSIADGVAVPDEDRPLKFPLVGKIAAGYPIEKLEDQPGGHVTVDLESRTVRAGEGADAIEDSFDIDDYTRWRLLEGLDDIGITLGHEPDIAAYEQTRPSWKPVTQTA